MIAPVFDALILLLVSGQNARTGEVTASMSGLHRRTIQDLVGALEAMCQRLNLSWETSMLVIIN
jgi:hypothetical protein